MLDCSERCKNAQTDEEQANIRHEPEHGVLGRPAVQKQSDRKKRATSAQVRYPGLGRWTIFAQPAVERIHCCAAGYNAGDEP